nr:alpha/beta hydrolase [uncultured Roseococcus sp.]
MKRFLLALGLMVSPALAAEPPRIVAEDLRIPSDTPGIELFLRNKRPATLTSFRPERTVLYIHGSTQPSETVFDLPIEGESWADRIAARGFDVWLVDVRGYGRSTRPASFREPAANGAPFGTTAEAVRDLGTAVDFIRSRRGIERLSLIGWSWGTIITGAYAGENPGRVASLVLIGPPWTEQGTPAASPAAPVGVWQEWTAETGLRRLQQGVPAGEAERIFPAATRAAWEAALLESIPEAAVSNPPRFRSPAGVLADGPAYWRAGRDFHDPARITAPTLIILGEWDGLAPLGHAQALFGRLRNAPVRRLVELPRASHFVLVETGRDALHREVQSFLEQD